MQWAGSLGAPWYLHGTKKLATVWLSPGLARHSLDLLVRTGVRVGGYLTAVRQRQGTSHHSGLNFLQNFFQTSSFFFHGVCCLYTFNNFLYVSLF